MPLAILVIDFVARLILQVELPDKGMLLSLISQSLAQSSRPYGNQKSFNPASISQ